MWARVEVERERESPPFSLSLLKRSVDVDDDDSGLRRDVPFCLCSSKHGVIPRLYAKDALAPLNVEHISSVESELTGVN